MIALFSLFIMAIGLMAHTFQESFNNGTKFRFYNNMLVFSCVGVVAIFLKKLAVLKWTK